MYVCERIATHFVSKLLIPVRQLLCLVMHCTAHFILTEANTPLKHSANNLQNVSPSIIYNYCQLVNKCQVGDGHYTLFLSAYSFNLSNVS